MRGVRLTALLVLTVLAMSCGGAAPRRPTGGVPLITLPTPGPAGTVVVEVFGTNGMRYGGTYGELGSPRSVEGTVPARLTFEFRSGFSMAFQKRAHEGELGIQVIVNGRPANRTTTTKPFGVVTYLQRVR